MTAPSQDDNSLLAPFIEKLMREIILPEGFVLVTNTLRRLHDGHLQSFEPVNANTRRVQLVPTPPMTTSPLSIKLQEETSPNDLKLEDNSWSLSSSVNNSPVHHGARSTREPSAKTVKRHAHAGDDDYTDVCGIFSPEISTPIKKHNPGKGDFFCPRCRSSFTRAYTVKEHFPDCVAKYGNPQSLRYTDHVSMTSQEAAIQRRSRAGRQSSVATMEGEAAGMSVYGQQNRFEEMNDALARTSLRSAREHSLSYDGTQIKTESDFGPDIPRESIESHFPPHGPQSRFPPVDFHPNRYGATPAWSIPQANRHDSSTPTPRTNPWNAGIPGSAAEHELVDMRATAPFEGWTPAAQTPGPANRDGLQGDDLDDFMDRRSHFSATPAAYDRSGGMGSLYEDCEMEE